MASALAARALANCCRRLVPPGLPPLRDALLACLHHPAARRAAWMALEDHSHPAWQRLKFEELLAQQLSQAAGAGGAGACCAAGRC